MGILIFNMGGRPGQAVCKRLFERRGFCVNKIWQTKVIQASKTHFTGFYFLFHPKCTTLEMLCYRLLIQIFQPWLKLRRTVHTVLSSSWGFLEISLFVLEQHGPMGRLGAVFLMLYQFTVASFVNQIRWSLWFWFAFLQSRSLLHLMGKGNHKYKNFNWQVKTIFEFLKNGFHDISSSLDLSFEDDSVADEKIPFLAYLARILKENSFFPYEPPAGSKLFRNLIAGFMKTYHHVPLNADVRKLNYIC